MLGQGIRNKPKGLRILSDFGPAGSMGTLEKARRTVGLGSI